MKLNVIFRLAVGIVLPAVMVSCSVDKVASPNHQPPAPDTAPYVFQSEIGGAQFVPNQTDSPKDAAVDANGCIFVLDSGFCTVTKFDSNWVYITRWGSCGTANGQFIDPVAIAVDGSGFVYVTDKNRKSVQMFNSSGNFIREFGDNGNTNTTLMKPCGICVDPLNRVVVADASNHTVRIYSTNGTWITNIGSAGSGDGEFLEPFGVAADPSGNIYVSDAGNYRIQKLSSNGVFLSKWGSEGTDTNQFKLIRYVEYYSGSLYVSDSFQASWIATVKKFTTNGLYQTNYGYFDPNGGPGGLHLYPGFAVGLTGSVIICNGGFHRMDIYQSNSTFQALFGAKLHGTTALSYPTALGRDPRDGALYVLDAYNNRCMKYDSNSVFLLSWQCGALGLTVQSNYIVRIYSLINAGSSRLYSYDSNGISYMGWFRDDAVSYPGGMTSDSNGALYVADTLNHRICRFGNNTNWGSYGSNANQFNAPEAICWDGSRYLYITDTRNHRIQKITTNGVFITNWGSYGTANGQMKFPRGVAVGTNGQVFVSDTGNNRIQIFSTNGEYIDQWGSSGSAQGGLNEPRGLIVEQDGRVFVADSGNHRIQIFRKN